MFERNKKSNGNGSVKNVKVSEDTQVYMTVEHTRKKNKSKASPLYGLVINGMLISAALLGAISLTGCGATNTSARTTSNVSATQVVATMNQQEVGIKADTAVISNLNQATRMIQAAIKQNQWSESMFDTLSGRLTAVEARLTLDSAFKNNADLLTGITNLDDTLASVDFSKSVETNAVALSQKQANAQQAINRIKATLGIVDKVVVQPQATASSVVKSDVVPVVSPSETTTPKAKIATPLVSTTLDTPIPFTAVVTPKSTPAPVVEVPVVAKAKPAVVKATPAPVAVAKPVVVASTSGKGQYGIATRYGNHTYGCKNQSEYDQVMKIIDSTYEASLSIKADPYLLAYMNGIDTTNKDAVLAIVPVNGQKLPPAVRLAAMKNAKALWDRMSPNVDYTTLSKCISIMTYAGKDVTGKSEGATATSAYDVLVNKLVKCDAIAQYESARLDRAGFSTQVVGGEGHAVVIIKVGKVWVNSGYMISDPSKYDVHVSSPTF